MFSRTIFVIGFWARSFLESVTSTSTRLPGWTKPDTPTTLSTLTAMALFFGVTRAATPPDETVVGASLDSKTGSPAFTG
ncbi:MAG: hypothetical protein A4E69_00232 [Syntrophus sp. PtaB.Bin138]|nr:MAG: hypothetical protein A4E69_00232 [Syntrophus sp. PtaB.Bin138]